MYSAVQNLSVWKEREGELLSCYTCYWYFHLADAHNIHFDHKLLFFTSGMGAVPMKDGYAGAAVRPQRVN